MGFSCLRHAESSQIRDAQSPLHGLAGSYPLYHQGSPGPSHSDPQTLTRPKWEGWGEVKMVWVALR